MITTSVMKELNEWAKSGIIDGIKIGRPKLPSSDPFMNLTYQVRIKTSAI